MLCPSDTGRGNLFTGSGGNWARGNYGYNGIQFWPGPNWKNFYDAKNFPDHVKILNFQLGVGGFDCGKNRQVFDFKKITDGTTHTIVLAELRVGVNENDRRGVWAMGMCGSNVHCRHAGHAINDCSYSRDDILGGPALATDIGRDTLATQCMGVDPGVDASGQSTVKSRHPGGVLVAMADASVQFLGDFIDFGNLGVSELGGCMGCINDTIDFDMLEPDKFGVWQRLNVSRDNYTLENQ
jgi:hypothetical protein